MNIRVFTNRYMYLNVKRKARTDGTHSLFLFETKKERIDFRFFYFIQACSIGTYKSTISNNQRCERCPLNSHTKDKGASSCICNDGFFRLNASLYNSPCFGK